MAAPTVDCAGLRGEYERAEDRRATAAEAERAAFTAWEQAYGAYDVASTEAADAFRVWTASLAG
jgi:hypothetical protein